MKRSGFSNLSLFISIFILLLIISPLKLYAELAETDEMQTVCQNWLKLNVQSNGNWGGFSNPAISDIKDISSDGILLARYFEIAPNGFVIVPVLMELPPVLVSSVDSHINFDEPGGVLFLIRDLL
ncbi:MAG: hypothetical protein GY865_12010, partial [candidate division Zixibacteria bacterium]|nr:hypothetical protein [candidate division Zixibacteria bacterium]